MAFSYGQCLSINTGMYPYIVIGATAFILGKSPVWATAVFKVIKLQITKYFSSCYSSSQGFQKKNSFSIKFPKSFRTKDFRLRLSDIAEIF